jgi:hypothetical protein
VQYATGPLTLIGGKFVTLAGAEVIKCDHGFQFLAVNIVRLCDSIYPHGFRGSYAFSEQVSLTLGVNNGWDQVSDANKDKTLELGLTLTPLRSRSRVCI